MEQKTIPRKDPRNIMCLNAMDRLDKFEPFPSAHASIYSSKAFDYQQLSN